MDKENVRSWLWQRWRERVPLPSMEQIRQELGWSIGPARPLKSSSNRTLIARPGK